MKFPMASEFNCLMGSFDGIVGAIISTLVPSKLTIAPLLFNLPARKSSILKSYVSCSTISCNDGERRFPSINITVCWLFDNEYARLRDTVLFPSPFTVLVTNITFALCFANSLSHLEFTERIASKYLKPTALFKIEQFFNLFFLWLRETPGKMPRKFTFRYFSTSSLFLIVLTKNP